MAGCGGGRRSGFGAIGEGQRAVRQRCPQHFAPSSADAIQGGRRERAWDPSGTSGRGRAGRASGSCGERSRAARTGADGCSGPPWQGAERGPTRGVSRLHAELTRDSHRIPIFCPGHSHPPTAPGCAKWLELSAFYSTLSPSIEGPIPCKSSTLSEARPGIPVRASRVRSPVHARPFGRRPWRTHHRRGVSSSLSRRRTRGASELGRGEDWEGRRERAARHLGERSAAASSARSRAAPRRAAPAVPAVRVRARRGVKARWALLVGRDSGRARRVRTASAG